MLENRYCATCGAEIVFDYGRTKKSFRIEDGKILRDDNNSDETEFNFHCSEDSEHYIGETQKQLDWESRVIQQFQDSGAYDL